MGKTVDRRQLQRQNTQIGATEKTNLLLSQICALLEQQNDAAGLPALDIMEVTEPEPAKRNRWTGN